jgi:hypothetical protein
VGWLSVYSKRLNPSDLETSLGNLHANRLKSSFAEKLPINVLEGRHLSIQQKEKRKDILTKNTFMRLRRFLSHLCPVCSLYELLINL